jgi:predicted DNA-binding transcriptional regulator AlpA
MRQELESVLMAARTLAPAELPRLLGDLREVEAVALSRLTAPVHQPQSPDTLLNVAEAAERLGMSVAYLYRHHSEFPFSRRMGKSLRFSNSGISVYLSSKRVSKRGSS